jgi:hypothetical protein
MKNMQKTLLLVVAAASAWMTGCGGSGSSSNNQPITVSITPNNPSPITVNGQASLTATVSNDRSNRGVNWSVSCGSPSCGSFNPTSTGSGSATTYTAPSTAPSGNVTITATSASDTSKIATVTISITQPPSISVAFNPAPPMTLSESAQTSLTAVVTNDSSNGGVNWSVSCGGGGSCGSFSSSSTASGTATTYTAPTSLPTPNTVTVTATSKTDTTKSVSATITIGAILADGTYVYHLAGQDGAGPCFIVGAFTVSGGNITGGEQDFSDSNSGYTNQLASSGNSLSVAGDNIQIVLNSGNTSIGNNGVFTLRGSKVSGSRALISEFDNFATTSGSLDLQTSTAAPSGGYAFTVSGVDLDNNGNVTAPLAIGGILNISGTSLSVSNSVFDYNFGGSNGQAQTFASGSVTVPDTVGRVSFDLTPSSGSGVPEFILTGYIVGPGQIQLVESQQDSLSDNLGGTALAQGSNTGKFNQGSVSGKTFVYSTTGVDTNGLVTILGGFSMGSNGSVSGPFALNDASQVGQVNLTGGNYTVDATGRVTLSNVTIRSSPFNAPFGFQMYLDGNGNAMIMGSDSVQVSAGLGYQQTSTNSEFSGSYALTGLGFLSDQNQSPWSAAGATSVSSDKFTGFTDYNDAGTPTPNVSLSGMETSSSNTLSLAGLNALSFSQTYNFAYLPIDGNRVVAISLDEGGLLASVLFEKVGQ